MLQEHEEVGCTLPARVSAHTESVHFLRTDEEHFYLKISLEKNVIRLDKIMLDDIR